jgi:ABC-type oligopeptide transport system substrate-binding subunit
MPTQNGINIFAALSEGTSGMRRIGLLIAFVAILVATGCNTKHVTHDVVLRRGIGGEPASLDPSAAADTFSFEVIRDLYEGLTTESPTGEVLPGVASSWTVDASGTKYTFTLRPDARWSNGAPVNAKDFVEAWRRALDPARGSPVADTLRPISGATEIIEGKLPPTSLGAIAEGDKRLVVRLDRPAPYFPQLLTHSATFPVFADSVAKTRNPKEWVSNGAYVLAQWVPGSIIKLRQNSNYWDRANVHIPLVNYIPIADENSEFRQYRADELDVTQSVPSNALQAVRRERPQELLVAPFLATAYYALNLKNPVFSKNLALRKALSLAIDRRALEASILPFGQRPAFGFVPPGTWNYEPQSLEWQNLSDQARVEQARRLYAQAGYSVANPLHVRVLFNSNNSIKQVAIAIAAMWKQTLGVESTLIDEEFRVFLMSRRDTSKWDVARLGWTADYNEAANFLDTLRSGSPNNDARYTRNQYDELLKRAAGTANPSDRRDLLQQAERLMLSDYPILPIYFFSSKRLIKPYVKGARPNPLNRLYSKHLEIVAH